MIARRITRIWWTTQERELVMKAFAKAYAAQGNRGLGAAFLAAQVDLPEQRRRPVGNNALANFHKEYKKLLQAGWFGSLPDSAIALPARDDASFKALQQLTNQAMDIQRSKQTPSAAQADAPAAAPSEPAAAASAPCAACAAERAAEPAVQLQRIAQSPMLAMALAMLDFPEVMERVVAIVAERYGLAQVQLEQPIGLELPKLTPLRRLPKIIIVAKLPGARRAEVSADMRGKLDLYFWSTDRSIAELKTRLQRCDAAVVQVDNVSHAAMQAAKARAPSFIPVSGGAETLRAALEKLVVH